MIACVWTGKKYGVEYVEKLRNMIRRHSTNQRIICLTDNDVSIDGVEMVQVHGLPGWWAKMALFNPDLRDEQCTFFDLDTIILGNIDELLNYRGEFAICENFTKLAGHKNWPCNYGSCVMSLPVGFGGDIYKQFMENRHTMINECTRGDQEAIERLYPNALYLQDVMPKGYFIGYRDFTNMNPDSKIAIFAGNNKPNNSRYQWAQEEWQ